jgi:hypothetical protein
MLGRGIYRGYYVNGLLTGKGELFYGKRPKPRKKKAHASVLDQPQSSNNAPNDGADANKKADKKPPAKGKQVGDSHSTNAGTNSSNPSERHRSANAEDELDHTDSDVITAYKAIQNKYKKCYMGFMLADNIMNGGYTMDTIAQIPTVIGRMDKQATLPIAAMMRNILNTTKRIKRKLEKLTDMDNFVRQNMVKRKKSIFRQQRHYTKKTMYVDDMVGLRKEEFDGRVRVREDRLMRTNMEKLMPTHHAVPRLKLNITDQPVTHLRDMIKLLKPDPEAGYRSNAKDLDHPRKKESRGKDKMNRTLAKVVVSDFEEAIERQRLIEYDALWEKAEIAFVNLKRAAVDDGDDTTL